MTPKEQAQAILDCADRHGFRVAVTGSILRVSKRIPAGDHNAFADADCMVGSVLELLPRTSPGSDWGTDGGSIGGLTALKSGNFHMQRSGGSKRVLAALAKLL